MIIVVRHGQTEFNRQQRLQGRMDSPLTQSGLDHAHALGVLIKSYVNPVDDWKIVSSPLGRARATAKIVCDVSAISSFASDDRLAEVSFGSWEGLTYAEADVHWSRTGKSSIGIGWANRCADGETFEQAIARVDNWLTSFKDQNVVAVTHGVVGCLLRGVFSSLDKEDMLRLAMPHDSIFILKNRKVKTVGVSGVKKY